AGKTTTLKIIAGIINPSSGKVLIKGKPVGESSKWEIGFLPENPSFFKNLKAREFLSLIGDLFNFPEDKKRERIDELLKLVNLEKFSEEKISTFSRGMVQRIGIAQAIFHDPGILILDEPMTGLDPLGRRMLKELIMNLREKGKTVILSTHDLEDAENLCDKVTLINRGELINTVDVKSLLPDIYEIIFVDGENCNERKVSVRKEELWDYLERIKKGNGRIKSVLEQGKGTLENFYMEHIKDTELLL
ncbi:MAG: ABC transporter ATP-binding protein, partial [Candidatus Aminicenantia bacterium]